MTIAVVIPCFRVGNAVFDVITNIGDEVSHIIVVDDACPENTGEKVAIQCRDKRVEIITHSENKGVGGAVISGYKRAMELGAAIVVKLDGDGQMDPALISNLVEPIENGHADYTKGNRFFDIDFLKGMPAARLFGNACLSFINKLTSGYWTIMDPTNGFTAIETRALSLLSLDQIENRYFFESDMLYHLGKVRAAVIDIPMQAKYGTEVSNLHIGLVLKQFPGKLMVRFLKRMVYNYFLRDFNAGSLMLILSAPLLAFSLIYGGSEWYYHFSTNQAAAPGVVMLAALPFLIGMHLLIAAISWDINNSPKIAIHPTLRPQWKRHA